MTRRAWAWLAVALLALGIVIRPAGAAPASASLNISIWAMTRGPDGNVWFVDRTDNMIGRVTTSGKVTLFKIPFAADPRGIAPGPNGDVYFSEYQGGGIGRITPAGKISQISLPGPKLITDYLTPGPGHTLWFVDGNNIGELTGSLKFVLHKLPGTNGLIIPENLAVTNAGAVWFTDFAPYYIKGVGKNVVIRMSPRGAISAFLISFGGSGIATSLAVGPDGNMWYSWTAKGVIGRVTQAGANSVYKTSQLLGSPVGMVIGPNHNLWLACNGTTVYSHTITVYPAGIEEVTSTGTSRPFQVAPTGNGNIGISAIAAGSDGNLWFPEVEYSSGIPVRASMDRMTPAGKVTHFSIPGVALLSAVTATPTSTPTPGPSPTPTATPTPAIPIAVQLAASVARGATQSIQVTTSPNADVEMEVDYPASGSFDVTSDAGAQGVWQYTWLVDAPSPGTATIKLTLESGSFTRHFTKTFQIT